jgi:hypothetical protein
VECSRELTVTLLALQRRKGDSILGLDGFLLPCSDATIEDTVLVIISGSATMGPPTEGFLHLGPCHGPASGSRRCSPHRYSPASPPHVRSEHEQQGSFSQINIERSRSNSHMKNPSATTRRWLKYARGTTTASSQWANSKKTTSSSSTL